MSKATYVEHANSILRKEIAEWPQFVAFGQNIDAGSRLSGLTKGISEITGTRIINSPNCENSLVGLGMGLSIEGMPSALILKQQDFLLLGIDQLFNTTNALRERQIKTPFVIVTIVVDSGWEGPQSSFNDTYGIGSLCRIPVYTPITADDIAESFHRAFRSGPSLVALSQRLFKQPTWEAPEGWQQETADGFTGYLPPDNTKSADDTVISLNFGLPQATDLACGTAASSDKANLYHAWHPSRETFQQVARRVIGSRSITIVDDSKTTRTAAQELNGILMQSGFTGKLKLIARSDTETWHLPSQDSLEVTGIAKPGHVT